MHISDRVLAKGEILHRSSKCGMELSTFLWCWSVRRAFCLKDLIFSDAIEQANESPPTQEHDGLSLVHTLWKKARLPDMQIATMLILERFNRYTVHTAHSEGSTAFHKWMEDLETFSRKEAKLQEEPSQRDETVGEPFHTPRRTLNIFHKDTCWKAASCATERTIQEWVYEWIHIISCSQIEKVGLFCRLKDSGRVKSIMASCQTARPGRFHSNDLKIRLNLEGISRGQWTLYKQVWSRLV